MRIGIVTETYPPEINGVALTVRSLAVGLAARGHMVDLIRPRQAGTSVDEPGIVAQEVPGASLPRYAGLRFGFPAAHRLHKHWKDSRPDAIYVATEGPLGWSAVRAAAQLRIPVITGFHTRFDHYAAHYGLGWLTPLVRRYMRWFHHRGRATLVPTDALVQELQALGITHARLLRRAVDTARFHPRHRTQALRTRWGADATTPVVLYVGRIAPEKNLELAVRAFEAIRRQQPEARFVWVGDGPSRPALQKAHPEFIFSGMQHGEDLASHYASADLFVFPSLSETFGNVIVEALASGLPVVAYAEGAAREHLLDGFNGYRVSSGDADAFVASAVRLGTDPALIRRMGRVAHASVARLSPASVIDEFENLLHEIAEESPHEYAITAPT